MYVCVCLRAHACCMCFMGSCKRKNLKLIASLKKKWRRVLLPQIEKNIEKETQNMVTHLFIWLDQGHFVNSTLI